MTEKVPMTVQGYHKLEDEVRTLIGKERPAVINAIEEARQHGDLSENAEYHAAKEKQGFIEGRIAELESKISRAEVIDPSKVSGSTIKFGASVTVCDDDTNETKVYQIVGADEADISHGLLSYTSPLAKALIGKSKDDFVEVTTPGGIKAYSIIKIEYK